MSFKFEEVLDNHLRHVEESIDFDIQIFENDRGNLVARLRNALWDKLKDLLNVDIDLKSFLGGDDAFEEVFGDFMSPTGSDIEKEFQMLKGMALGLVNSNEGARLRVAKMAIDSLVETLTEIENTALSLQSEVASAKAVIDNNTEGFDFSDSYDQTKNAYDSYTEVVAYLNGNRQLDGGVPITGAIEEIPVCIKKTLSDAAAKLIPDGKEKEATSLLNSKKAAESVLSSVHKIYTDFGTKKENIKRLSGVSIKPENYGWLASSMENKLDNTVPDKSKIGGYDLIDLFDKKNEIYKAMKIAEVVFDKMHSEEPIIDIDFQDSWDKLMDFLSNIDGLEISGEIELDFIAKSLSGIVDGVIDNDIMTTLLDEIDSSIPNIVSAIQSNIAAILTEVDTLFTDFSFPDMPELDEMLESFVTGGFDRAVDIFTSGDLEGFMDLNSITGSNIGCIETFLNAYLDAVKDPYQRKIAASLVDVFASQRLLDQTTFLIENSNLKKHSLDDMKMRKAAVDKVKKSVPESLDVEKYKDKLEGYF
jgi:hypothetical protein